MQADHLDPVSSVDKYEHLCVCVCVGGRGKRGRAAGVVCSVVIVQLAELDSRCLEEQPANVFTVRLLTKVARPQLGCS